MIRAVLTMDDIPSRNTPAIVDYLNDKKITAVMFAEGRRIEELPGNAVYALQHGMIVGNHSYSHPNFLDLSFEEGVKEIERTEQLLEDIYKKAGVERRFRPFRFPYGRRNADIHKYLAQNGFDKLDDSFIPYQWWKDDGRDKTIDTLWTFDFEEYRMNNEDDFTIDDVWKHINDPEPQSGVPLLKEGASHIILLHAHDKTEEAVPGYYRLFLDYLLEHGVVFMEPKFVKIMEVSAT